MDAKTGEIIHHVNGYKKRYPASLTKMMTLYILFDEIKRGSIKKTDLIYFSRNASNKQPSKLGIPSGGSISVDSAIKALAIKSANDVATAVAEHISGTETLFSNKMSMTAETLGMKNTVFKNASGLPNSKQLTTPYDMVILGLRIKNDFPNEYYVFGLKSFSYDNKKYISHNKLLFSSYNFLASHILNIQSSRFSTNNWGCSLSTAMITTTCGTGIFVSSSYATA